MTVEEMHVAVDQQLQKVASFVYLNLRDEEIDYFLTRMQQRYVKQRLSFLSDMKRLGFEQVQKRLDDYRALKTKSNVEMYTAADSEPNRLEGYLPEDYMFLINDRSHVFYDCRNLTISTATRSEYYSVLEFVDTNETSSPYYGTVRLTDDTNSTVLFDMANFPNFAATLTSKSLKYEVIDLMLQEVNRGSFDFKLYWEYYRNLYHRNSFILVDQTTTHATTDTTLYVNASDSSTNTSFSSLSLVVQVMNPNYNHIVPNRLVESEELYEILRGSFSKTRFDSPVSSLREHYIDIFHNERFILKDAFIDYIRKPKRISLSLSQDSELAEHTHPEIVDLTVKHILEIFESPRYQTDTIEQIQSE